MSLSLEVLKLTLAKIKPQAEEFSASFYDNLFKDYPEIKSLFANTDMRRQRTHLVRALIVIIDNISTPKQIKGALKELGARHINYGVVEEYYPLFGESLLKTFKSYLKDDWTSETEKAWRNAYQQVTNIMSEAAKKMN